MNSRARRRVEKWHACVRVRTCGQGCGSGVEAAQKVVWPAGTLGSPVSLVAMMRGPSYDTDTASSPCVPYLPAAWEHGTQVDGRRVSAAGAKPPPYSSTAVASSPAVAGSRTCKRRP